MVDGKSDGLHDDPIITLDMFIGDPSSVRYDARLKAGKATINGVSLAGREDHRASEADRRVPRHQDGGSDRQGDRGEGQAHHFCAAITKNQ